MPIFERLTAGWFNDNVGLLLLLEQLAERGEITRLGAGLLTVGVRQTGMWPKVITQLINWVIAVGFDNGRSQCWGRCLHTWCGSDRVVRHWVVGGIVGGKYRGAQLSPLEKVQLREGWAPSEKVQANRVG